MALDMNPAVLIHAYYQEILDQVHGCAFLHGRRSPPMLYPCARALPICIIRDHLSLE